jgi:hypothetical protein
MAEAFAVKDCALIAIATGRHARNLRELAVHLADVQVGAIYHHFWGGRMQPAFDEPEFQNDFAGWVRHGIHDYELSERLGILDPTNYPNLEALRSEMLDLIDERLHHAPQLHLVMADQPFSFNRSQIVIYDTQLRITKPAELRAVAPAFSVGTIFYHLVDARRREPIGVDDFRAWLAQFDSRYDALRARIEAIDPYFCSLTELKSRLVGVFNEFPPE